MVGYVIANIDDGQIVQAFSWFEEEINQPMVDEYDLPPNTKIIPIIEYDYDLRYLNYKIDLDTNELIKSPMKIDEPVEDVITTEKILDMSNKIMEMQDYLLKKEMEDLEKELGGLGLDFSLGGDL